MADYRELLRRAIGALPENNGAARRAVYEKARTALVGQLRAIAPPLPAREITQHRLQLEDCIREVEQEASEAVIKLSRSQHVAATPRQPEPAQVAETAPPTSPEPEPLPEPAPEPEPDTDPELEPEREGAPAVLGAQMHDAKGQSIEDIIAQAEEASEGEPEPVEAVAVDDHEEAEADVAAADSPPKADAEGEDEAGEAGDPGDELPRAVARPDLRVLTSTGNRETPESAPRAPVGETRSEPFRITAVAGNDQALGSRMEAAMGSQAAARKPVPAFEPFAVIEDQPVEAALSSVREVEVEAADSSEAREAEGAIERAIETLDRAARGEASAEPEPASGTGEPAAPLSLGKAEEARVAEALPDNDFEPATGERASSGLTIFLVVFALLLAGVGGGGYWAWQEGYVDLDQMFGRSTATATNEPSAAPTQRSADVSTADAGANPSQPTQELTGPGNTATETTADEPATALEGVDSEERLEPTPEPASPQVAGVEAGTAANADLAEERLPSSSGELALADDPSASVDPEVLAGSQALLLEAPESGTGAVPFSGTVEWSRGVDEVGLPTLVAHADIPARNLGVQLVFRRNADPSLPASHLMEIDFDISDTFAGGAIASVPGILLKNMELVQGAPLAGASVRVVENSFLFALSNAEKDVVANRDLFSSRKWMDLTMVYATGRRAIITIEKDAEAETLFTEVLAEWDEASSE